MSCFKVQGNFLLLCSSNNFVGYSGDFQVPSVNFPGSRDNWVVSLLVHLFCSQQNRGMRQWFHMCSKPMIFSWCSRDFFTHKYPRFLWLIKGFSIGGPRCDRGASNYRLLGCMYKTISPRHFLRKALTSACLS